jgi:hypothetical protein
MSVACYGDFVAKNRVHAEGNQTFLPQLGRPYSIHKSKVPPLGASVDPLWQKSAELLFLRGPAKPECLQKNVLYLLVL